MNTNKVKPFSCPNCGKKLPFKYAFNANTSSRFTCKNCGTICKLAKPLDIAPSVIFGFLSVAIPGRLVTDYFDSIELGLLTGALSLPFAVLIVWIYAYSTLEFTRD